jgi:hypothetical protein
MTYQPDWDLDLKAGEFAESVVKELLLLEDSEIEIKYDRKAMSTGNLYIETHCRRRDGWQPSGITATKARVWFFMLNTDAKLTVSMTTEALRREVRRFAAAGYTAEEKDGSHPTRGVLVPLRAVLLTPAREAVA